MSVRIQRNSLPLLCLNFKKTLLLVDWHEHFRDDFDDGILEPEWTTHGLSAYKKIVEGGGIVKIEIANNANAVWFCNVNNIAPKMYVPLEVTPPCRITTKLNAMPPDPGASCPEDVMAGIFIGTDPEGLGDPDSDLAFLWGRFHNGDNSLKLMRNCGGYDAMVGCGFGCLPKWLMIYIDADEDIRFYYSDDGSAWTQYENLGAPFVLSDYYSDSLYVGLFAKNGITDPVSGPYNNVEAQFEFFLIEVKEEFNPIEEEYLAPIDTRAPTTFYDGRIKQMSSLKRAVDDKTGLFQIADMSITLANADKHYSQKMASQFLKNQEATLYHAWTEEREALKMEIIKLIVEDYSMKGPDFIIKLKDITQKYFTIKVPANICTKEGVDGVDAFPDIHPEYEGWCMPEILGNASLLGDDYEYKGAVQAVYIDTTGPPYRCLASAGLITIPDNQVWIGTTPKTTPDQYTVEQPDDGHTYIHFADGHNPGTETVSFNAHGYSLAAWNSAAGYVQNLAYIIQYYLRYIMGIPASLINVASFTTLAGYYVDMGVHLNGYLIIQDRMDGMEILRQLLFTGGAKGFMALDGKFNVARKNICNWQIASVDQHIFEQIELFGSPHRKWNLTSAINTVNAQFGYIPWQNLYTGAKSEYRDNRFERPMEDDIRDREKRTREAKG